VTDPFVAASSGPLFLIVLLGLFVFLFVVPNRRRQRAAREKLSSIEVGQEVLTVGGLIGRVVATDDSELKVEIADGVIVRIARRGVATVLAPEEPEEEVLEEPEEEVQEEPAEPASPGDR
jgi:preprotein translocase subunit YajC